MTHQWNYSPSKHELTIINPSHLISYFADTVDHESMMINMDSKTIIDEVNEDGIPVILKQFLFKPFNKFKVTSCILFPPTTLSRHINNLPKWARTLVQNYKDGTGPSLLEIIQDNRDIIIASDGSKSNHKSGGAWIISDSSGTTSISGSNPDFGPISSMNSHRSEVYAVLSALLFLHEYCRYFMLPLSSQIKYFCDNLEVVNKMKRLILD